MYFSKNHYLLCVGHYAGHWDCALMIKTKMLPKSMELTDRLFAYRVARKMPKWLEEDEFWM